MSSRGMKVSKSDRIFDAIVNTLLAGLVLLVLYPLYFIVIASISDPNAVNAGEVLLLPKRFSLGGYEAIFNDNRIWTGYKNTVIYTFFGTLINVTITLMAGYALSRKDLVGRSYIMGIFVFTMYFSGGLIPSYLLVKSLGLYNSPIVMIILGAVGVWNMIISKTYYQSTIPSELLEAAFIDGCSNGRFFLTIVLPLSKAITAIMILYYAVGHWNQFFTALIYLSKPKYFPLQLTLREILIQSQHIESDVANYSDMGDKNRMAEAIKYGVIIVSSLPVLILYPFVQKYFIKGVMIGSVKG